jgi:hypothetical protein
LIFQVVTGARKRIPCPTGSYYLYTLFTNGLLIALMMEAESIVETSVNFYQTTQRNILEESHLKINICSSSQEIHLLL